MRTSAPTILMLSNFKLARNSAGVSTASVGMAPMIVPTTIRLPSSTRNALTSMSSELSEVNNFIYVARDLEDGERRFQIGLGVHQHFHRHRAAAEGDGAAGMHEGADEIKRLQSGDALLRQLRDRPAAEQLSGGGADAKNIAVDHAVGVFVVLQRGFDVAGDDF